MLEVGSKAPDFTLESQSGERVSLSDFLGKKVILYFYPKDSTPGCTKEACAFRDAYPQFLKKGAVVLGVSKDTAKAHQRFAQKQELPFYLLADPQLEVLMLYEVWQEKKLYGKVSMGTVRSTYLIDENGVIERVYEKVKPETHPQQILDDLN